MEYRNECVNKEENKEFMVVETDTVPCPWTMVIHSEYTSIRLDKGTHVYRGLLAHFAVMSSGNLDSFTFEAVADFF